MADLFTAFEPLAGTRHVVVTERKTSVDVARFLRATGGERLERFERHYTPEHGSRLNVAEMELSAPARPCPDRRIPDLAALTREVAAWERDRNAAVVTVDWQFTAGDARVKLRRRGTGKV